VGCPGRGGGEGKRKSQFPPVGCACRDNRRVSRFAGREKNKGKPGRGKRGGKTGDKSFSNYGTVGKLKGESWKKQKTQKKENLQGRNSKKDREAGLGRR